MTDPTLTFRRTEHPDGCLVVHVRGEIDGASAPALDRELTAALNATPRRLLVDGTEVSFCDSRGIAVLIAAWRRAAEVGTALAVRTSPRLRRVLTLTGVDTLIDLD